MNALLVVVATVAMGIEVGWEPLPGGGHEYTIQIEPQLLEVLEKGEDEVFSEVPAGIDVRRYRILVGTGKLRRDSGPLEPTATDPPRAASSGTREPASRLTQPNAGAPPDAAANPPEDRRAPEPKDPFGAPPTEQPADPLDDIPPATASDPNSQPPPATQDPLGTAPAATAPAANELEFPAGPTPELPPAAGGSVPTSESPDPNAEPRDPWADSASKGRAETLIVGADKSAEAGKAPAKLPQGIGPPGSIKQTTLETAEASPSDLQEHEAAKPELEGNPPSQPWFPLVAAIVLLGCSIGGNIYLGWIAMDARARYRSAVAKFRGAPA